MSQRLPIPGQDDGTWGDILNGYLEVSLSSTGALNPGVVGTNQIQDNAVTNTQLDSATQATLASVAGKYTKPGGGIPSSDLSGTVQTNLTLASTAVQSVNGKTGTSVSLAASDVSAVPTSQLGATSGVATLDGSSQLTGSQLPSSVVSGSSSGGIAAWAPSTTYLPNKLITIGGATYICNVAHTSGASFSGVGTNWALVGIAGSTYIVCGAPGTDITTELQSAINTANTNNTDLVIQFAQYGTYLINGASQTGTANGYSYAGQILFPARLFTAGRIQVRICGLTAGPAGASRETSDAGEPASPSGVVLLSNATSGYVFDAIAAEQIFGNSSTDIGLTVENLTVRLPDNPQAGGINAKILATFNARGKVSIDVNATGNAITFPTGSNSGLVMGAFGNMALQEFRGQVVGFPIGITHSEHALLDDVVIENCAVALVPNNTGHYAEYRKVIVSKCPTILQPVSNNYLSGTIDYEVGASATGSWHPKNFLDLSNGGDVIGNLVVHLSGGPDAGLFLSALTTACNFIRPKQGSLGWKDRYPLDTFTRIANISGQMGSTDATFHPYSVNQGWYCAGSGSAVASVSSPQVVAGVTYYDRLSGQSRIVSANITLTGSYNLGLMLGYITGTNNYLYVTCFGGQVKLVKRVSGANTQLAISSASVVAAGSHTLTAVVQQSGIPGATTTITAYIDTTSLFSYTLVAQDITDLADSAVNVRTGLHIDGLFANGDTASTVTQFNVGPLTP